MRFDEDILAFFGLPTVLATLSKIWAIFFPNLLVTLAALILAKCNAFYTVPWFYAFCYKDKGSFKSANLVAVEGTQFVELLTMILRLGVRIQLPLAAGENGGRKL